MTESGAGLGASANNSIGECAGSIGCERAPSGLRRFFGGPVVQDRKD